MKTQRVRDMEILIDAMIDAVNFVLPKLVDKAVAKHFADAGERSPAGMHYRRQDNAVIEAGLARANHAIAEAGARERARPKVPAAVAVEQQIRRARLEELKRGGSKR